MCTFPSFRWTNGVVVLCCQNKMSNRCILVRRLINTIPPVVNYRSFFVPYISFFFISIIYFEPKKVLPFRTFAIMRTRGGIVLSTKQTSYTYTLTRTQQAFLKSSISTWFYLQFAGQSFPASIFSHTHLSSDELITNFRNKKGNEAKSNFILPVDHPSICWRTLKNSVTFAANFVLYHEIAGMYPIVFDTYYRRLSVIHRSVTPANVEKRKPLVK